ncbi:MAG: hypothetical protein JWO03_2613 [Bacteroidetes bacterium]|nr:hypothetical protein [Bacteroidota bacterium]
MYKRVTFAINWFWKIFYFPFTFGFMKEDLLHFIWRYRLYDTTDLKSTDDQTVEIIQPGLYNTDAGADFGNARIRIGGVLLAGNVEMHVRQKDWYTHRHDHDAAYNNVILHVVYEVDDKPTLLQNGQPVPVLNLKGHIAQQLLSRYELLKDSRAKIPCESMIKTLPEDLSMTSYYDKLVIERMQSKVAVTESMLAASRNDWDQVAFRMIAGYFGGSVNKEPLRQLASSLPLSVIHKHRAEPLQIEGLLFGQAGMLAADFDDEYPRALKREYTYLRKLHTLMPMEAQAWKFFRVRPVSFPTVKIAQLAALLVKEEHLFGSILACRTLSELRAFFEVRVNPYWDTHFQFDKPAAKGGASPGNMLTDVLVINAVVPLLFSYGRYKDDENLCQRALDLLYEIPAEDNAIIRMWDGLGLKAKTANDTQALLQLNNEYCVNKRCLHCQIGLKLLQ